jgi:hypothetical protein
VSLLLSGVAASNLFESLPLAAVEFGADPADGAHHSVYFSTNVRLSQADSPYQDDDVRTRFNTFSRN